MELAAFFKSLSDPRRKQGQRYPFEASLWLIFIAICAGSVGYRQIGKFCKSNKVFFTEYFDLKHGVPSYVTIRTLLMQLDKGNLESAFYEHIGSKMLLSGDWVSADGQTLRSTVQNAHESSHDFCSLVSLYSQSTGLSLAMKDYLNKKNNEIELFRTFLANLQNKGLHFTLDALHCQKKL